MIAVTARDENSRRISFRADYPIAERCFESRVFADVGGWFYRNAGEVTFLVGEVETGWTVQRDELLLTHEAVLCHLRLVPGPAQISVLLQALTKSSALVDEKHFPFSAFRGAPQTRLPPLAEVTPSRSLQLHVFGTLESSLASRQARELTGSQPHGQCAGRAGRSRFGQSRAAAGVCPGSGILAEKPGRHLGEDLPGRASVVPEDVDVQPQASVLADYSLASLHQALAGRAGSGFRFRSQLPRSALVTPSQRRKNLPFRTLWTPSRTRLEAAHVSSRSLYHYHVFRTLRLWLQRVRIRGELFSGRGSRFEGRGGWRGGCGRGCCRRREELPGVQAIHAHGSLHRGHAGRAEVAGKRRRESGDEEVGETERTSLGGQCSLPLRAFERGRGRGAGGGGGWGWLGSRWVLTVVPGVIDHRHLT